MSLRMRSARQAKTEQVSQGSRAEPQTREDVQPRQDGSDREGVPVGGGRERRGSRTRELGASAVGAAGSGVLLIARVVMTAAVLIALLIGLAIVLRDVGANGQNTIVKGIHEGANFFAGAFTGLIAFNGHPKRAITVDWGIALVAYLIVGALIASVIARIARGGLRYEQTHRAAV